MSNDLLSRITSDPDIFNGKPIIRGHRLAVEHVLGMLAAGDTQQDILAAYDWLEWDDIEACMLWHDLYGGDEPPKENVMDGPANGDTYKMWKLALKQLEATRETNRLLHALLRELRKPPTA